MSKALPSSSGYFRKKYADEFQLIDLTFKFLYQQVIVDEFHVFNTKLFVKTTKAGHNQQ